MSDVVGAVHKNQSWETGKEVKLAIHRCTVLCVENPKESTKKLKTINNKFRKVAAYNTDHYFL